MDNDFEPKELLETRWKLPNEDINKEFLNEDYLKEHSTAYKILNDLLTKVWSSDSEDEISKNNSKPGSNKQKSKKDTNQRSKNNTNQGSKSINNPHNNNQLRMKGKPMYKSFTAYPRASSLTVAQQEMFLKLMKKFTNNHSPFLTTQDQQELQMYMALLEKVNKEQIEYLNFLRDYAIANQSRYMSINPGIRKYISELWKAKLKAPLKYPQFYENYRTIALVCDLGNAQLELVHDEILLQLGLVPRLKHLKYFGTISTNYEEFVAQHPIIDYENENQTEVSANKMQKCPVSQDKNADQLASYANIDFVISSSALKRICDNHGPLFNNPWEMPITVKELEIRENYYLKKKRVIFIDKAFPPKKMTVVDKIIWFHKIAAKDALVRESQTAALRLDGDNKKIKTFKQSNVVQNAKMDNASTFDADIFSGDGVQESFGIEGSSCMERQESSKQQITTQGIEGMKVIFENKLEKGNIIEIDEKRENKQVINSSDISDSEDDKLVITEDDKAALSGKKCNKEDKLKSPHSSESEESKKKPLTRSMARMLENLSKIEKMVGINPPNVNLSTFKNEENMTQKRIPVTTCSPEKEKAKKDPENLETAVKCKNLNLNVSPRKERAIINRKRKIDEKNEEQTSTSPEKKQLDKGEQRRSILDELLEQQSIMLTSGQKNKDDTKVEKKRVNPRRSCVLVDYEPMRPPDKCNWVYRSFFLRKIHNQKHQFKILVRHKYDAMEFVDRCKMVTIVPKMEFQPEFGAEAVTISELTRQWISVLIRPNSTLLRARLNAFTSAITMIEKKDIKDFMREEKLHNIQASHCLKTLYSVLRGLSDIPPGQYVLKHDPKMGAFINLSRAVSEQRDNLYDLHKQYELDSTQEESQSISNLWIPIDVGIITPTHELTNRVPGTFNPNTKSGSKKKKKKKGKKVQEA